MPPEGRRGPGPSLLSRSQSRRARRPGCSEYRQREAGWTGTSRYGLASHACLPCRLWDALSKQSGGCGGLQMRPGLGQRCDAMRCDEMKEEQGSEQASGLAGKRGRHWGLAAACTCLQSACTCTASASGPSLRSVGVPSTVDGLATTCRILGLNEELDTVRTDAMAGFTQDNQPAYEPFRTCARD